MGVKCHKGRTPLVRLECIVPDRCRTSTPRVASQNRTFPELSKGSLGGMEACAGVKGFSATTHPSPPCPMSWVSMRVGRWGYILCLLFRIPSQQGEPVDRYHYQLSLWLWLWCLLVPAYSMVAGSLMRPSIASSIGQLLSSYGLYRSYPVAL